METEEYSAIFATTFNSDLISVEIPWDCSSEDDIKVWIISKNGDVKPCDDWTYDSDSKNLTAYNDLGDWSVMIVRDEKGSVEITQSSEGNIKVSDLVEQFKKDNRILEQLQDLQKRCLIVSGDEELNPLPFKENRANKILTFDENGQPNLSLGIESISEIEEVKQDVEQIKTDTQTIFNNTVDVYEETSSVKDEAVDAKESALFFKGQAEQARIEAEQARDEAQEISDPENRIGSLQESTQDLQLFKSNSGALHFSKGALASCYAFQNFGNVFSMCCVLKMTEEAFNSIGGYAGIIGGYSASNNSTFVLQKGGATSNIINARVLIYKENPRIDYLASFDANIITDGKPHCIVCSYNLGTIKVFVDGNQVATASKSYESNITPDIFQIGDSSTTIDAISNVAIFSFDVSDATSPYTLADYQQGKPIPPLLLKGTQKVLDNNYTDWDIYNKSSFEISQDSNADTITATCISPTNYCTFTDDWKSGLKAGDVVSVSWESIEVSSGVSVIGTRTNTATNGSVEIANGGTFVQQADSSYIYFQANLSSNVSVGDTITVKGLRIRVNGALLALENYTIKNGTTQQIFDYSGNANDATCSGTIKGDNDTRVQRLVDFIKA